MRYGLTLLAAGLLGTAALLTVSSLVDGPDAPAQSTKTLPATYLRVAEGRVEIRAAGVSRPIGDLVDLGSALYSGRIDESDDAVVVRGVVGRTGSWDGALAEFTSDAATRAPIDVVVTEVDLSLSGRALCRRMFAEIADADIEFRLSGSTLRTASYAALERFVGLLTNCRNGRLKIVGHTDASGNETYNRILSLERAHAVADFLHARGINGGRVLVAGRGSAEPRADNRTSRGRARNRRIEFEWLSGDQPESAGDSTAKSSTSNTSVAPGGMTPPAPRSP